MAIACIIASYLVFAIQAYKYLDLSDRSILIDFIIVSLGEFAIVLGIYFRKNWVRWLFVATIAIWLVKLVGDRFNGPALFQGVGLLLVALNLTLSVVFVILLFYPESNEWFKKRPAPAAFEPLVKS